MDTMVSFRYFNDHYVLYISLQYMLANLKATAETPSKKEWDYGGPTDADDYNN